MSVCAILWVENKNLNSSGNLVSKYHGVLSALYHVLSLLYESTENVTQDKVAKWKMKARIIQSGRQRSEL